MTSDCEFLNSLPSSEAESQLLSCCGCARWAREVANARPFRDKAELFATADEVWWSLDSAGWLEAFRAHPRIGEKQAPRQTSARSLSWSEQEQSSVNESAVQTMQALASLNREYEEKFGYIFIVCATGKSSDEMLSILRERLKNDPADELRIAAAEQAKITRLRIEKLLNQ
jgi:OHCU decarboxylase